MIKKHEELNEEEKESDYIQAFSMKIRKISDISTDSSDTCF